MRSEVSKLDYVQGPLPRYEVHKGVEVTREVGKGTRDQDKVFAIRDELLEDSRARMMDVKILCSRSLRTSICARLNRDRNASQGFCSKRLTQSSKGFSGESSIVDTATCIDNHVRDDSQTNVLRAG